MTHEAVPHHRLECLGKRGHERWVDHGDDHHMVAHLRRVAAITPDNAEDKSPCILGEINRLDELGAHPALEVAATDR